MYNLKPMLRSKKGHFTLRKPISLLSLVCAGVIVTSCAQAEPEPMLNKTLDMPIRIVVNSQDVEQVIFGEIYRYTLMETGREASVVLETPERSESIEESLRARAGELIVGCTGDLLDHFNPVAARDFSKDYKDMEQTPGGEDYLAKTHIELIESLPPRLATTDPSPASGCEDLQEDLPQNFTPIFVKQSVTREEKQALHAVTKFVTNKELEELVAKSQEAGSVSEVVEQWVGKNASGEEFETSDNQKEKGLGADPKKREEAN